MYEFTNFRGFWKYDIMPGYPQQEYDCNDPVFSTRFLSGIKTPRYAPAPAPCHITGIAHYRPLLGSSLSVGALLIMMSNHRKQAGGGLGGGHDTVWVRSVLTRNGTNADSPIYCTPTIQYCEHNNPVTVKGVYSYTIQGLCSGAGNGLL